jgi:hypothetical protein
MNLDTGDLILFEEDDIISECICKETNNKYSHVGIVVKNSEGLFLLESTGIEKDNNSVKFETTLCNLEYVLLEHKAPIYTRRLEIERDIDFYLNFKKAYDVVNNKPYDIVDFVKLIFLLRIDELHRKDTFYCSALVAFIYVCLGILDYSTPWSMVTPKDLSTESRQLKWLQKLKMEERLS